MASKLAVAQAPERALDPIGLVASVQDLLVCMGEPAREGLLRTPERVARFYQEFLDPAPFVLTTFEAEGCDEMVVQTNIPFYSLCEHHLLPFFGTAAVAYVPDGRIVGLSKLARIVQWYARRPQNQERITGEVASRLMTDLSPVGVGVQLRARHLCMEMRGVEAPGTQTTTTALRGFFRTDASARAEFLAAVRAAS